MRSDVHMKAILALLAAIVLEVSGGVSIIIPKDYVANLCQKNCQQSTVINITLSLLIFYK